MLRSRFRFYIWIFVLANSALALLLCFWPAEFMDHLLSQSAEFSELKVKEGVKAKPKTKTKESLALLQTKDAKYILAPIRMAGLGILFMSLILLRTAWDPNAYRGFILRISLYFLSMGSLGAMMLRDTGFPTWIVGFTVLYFVIFLFLILFASYNLRVRD